MTTATKSAIVFGKGRVAITATELLQSAGYRIEMVIPGTESTGDTSFSDWARAHGLEVRVGALDDLLPSHADLGISVYFDKIFRQRHIDRFGLLLNVHNSLLPRYRGVRPVNWALKNGEREHGVSLHLITPGIDEGSILDQEAFPINSDVDEVRDVYARCLDAAEAMLERAVPRLWDTTPRAQDESLAFYHSALDDEQLGERRYLTRSAARLEQ